MMRPQRISSEAPEVVPEQPEKFVVNSHSHLDRFRRNKGSQYQKQLADEQTPGVDNRSPPARYDSPDGGEYETSASLGSPREYRTTGPGYGLAPFEAQTAAERRKGGRKACGLITTIILVILAFLIGGGVGGGIGGAIAVKNKDKSTSSGSPSITAPPTATSSGSTSVTTQIVDQAGCPVVNNTTYNSTVTPYTFLQLCSTDVQPVGGQFIEVANKVTSTFDSCLDWCAQYTGNSTTKGQCVAATWVIFSSLDPGRNSRCYLKNSTGVRLPSSDGQQLASAFLNSA